MATSLRTQNQVPNINDWGQQYCDIIYSATLASSTDTTVTVPGAAAQGNITAPAFNKFIAVFRCDDDAEVWTALNATAAVPAGATFSTTTSELIVGAYGFAKHVKAGDVIHVITSGSNVDISIAFYAVSE